jgi:aminopeptidase N
MRAIRLAGAGVLLVAFTALAGADTYPRQPVDALHYRFSIALRDDSDEIAAEATVRVRLLGDGVREFWLDLVARDQAKGKGMTVSSVTSAAHPLPFTHTGDRLRIQLPSPSRSGDVFTCTITYAGVPAAGLRVGPNKHGERTFFSSNWPDKARHWLPTIDHISDKATAEFVVTAPAHYQVVANGRLTEESDLPGGLRRTEWSESVPISPWLYTVGVARFAVHHADAVQGIPLESWVFPQDRDAGTPAFEVPSRQALTFYTSLVGPYLYEKLANVEAAGVSGGMEHASAIAYGESSVTGRPIATLVAHEIAHAWFGDGVTERDWDDVWLSEGFATYLTHLFVEHVEGRDAFVAGLQRDRDRVAAAEKKTPDTPIVHRNLSDMSRVLNTFVYQKAGWVLHMLRTRIGDEAFRSSLREYYRRYQNATASTDDFRRVVEEASGQDLGAFFTQWLNRPGVPAIKGAWQYWPDRKIVEVTLEQVQQAEPFQLPLEIGIASDGQPRKIEKVELTGRTHRFEFAADREPTGVVLDPNTRALAELAIVRTLASSAAARPPAPASPRPAQRRPWAANSLHGSGRLRGKTPSPAVVGREPRGSPGVIRVRDRAQPRSIPSACEGFCATDATTLADSRRFASRSAHVRHLSGRACYRRGWTGGDRRRERSRRRGASRRKSAIRITGEPRTHRRTSRFGAGRVSGPKTDERGRRFPGRSA